MSSAETAPVETPQKPPPIYKGPPRPPPTQTYDYKVYNPKPTISYIRTLEQARTVLWTALQSGPLGFDLEWRPTHKKGAPENPVALIQLANDQSVMLFQVSCIGFPSELKQILESSRIVKAGVGIQGDARKLFRDCKVSIRNCVDLSLLARTVDNAQWAGRYNSPIGLARLIECYEYKLLLKGRVSRSDWAAVLNSKQQEYAGNDAHAGYTLYKKLEGMIPLMSSQPKAAWYSFNVQEGILCNDDGLPWEAENPDYDPGWLPEPKAPMEAKLRSKRKEAEARAAQQLPYSSRVEGVDSGVETPLKPLFPISKFPDVYPVESRIPPQAALPASSSMPGGVSGFTMKQSTLTNSSGPVNYPYNVEISQPRSFPGKRYGPSTTARDQHFHGNNRRWRHSGASNRLSSVDIRDNIGPSATHVRGNS